MAALPESYHVSTQADLEKERLTHATAKKLKIENDDNRQSEENRRLDGETYGGLLKLGESVELPQLLSEQGVSPRFSTTETGTVRCFIRPWMCDVVKKFMARLPRYWYQSHYPGYKVLERAIACT